MVKELVQPHDIASTVLKHGGYSEEELKKTMPDSIDLMSVSSESNKARDHAVCLYRATSINDNKLYWSPPIHATMYRESKFKLNVYHRPAVDKKPLQGQLFDMEKDPLETNNLWDDPKYAETKMYLYGRLMNWIVETDAKYNGGRGGELFPDKAEWCENNPL